MDGGVQKKSAVSPPLPTPTSHVIFSGIALSDSHGKKNIFTCKTSFFSNNDSASTLQQYSGMLSQYLYLKKIF